jgi:hypothetical protein
MGLHTEELQKEIAAAQAELRHAHADLDREQQAIHEAILHGDDDKGGDPLQVARDVTRRRCERLRIALSSLESRWLVAAAQDAKAALPTSERAIASRMKRLAESYTQVASAWHALVSALEACEQTQRDCQDVDTLRAEMLATCLTHDLAVPELPSVPAFPDTPVTPAHRIRGVAPWQEVLHRFRAVAGWEPVVSKVVKDRRDQAEAEANRRKAAAWRATPPAQHTPVSSLSLAVVNALPSGVRDTLFRPASAWR